jgi:hypothetical protein
MSLPRPPVLQHEVLPLLEDRRRAVPVERELEDDDVVPDEELLFAPHVEVEARILLVQVVERERGVRRHGGHEGAVDARPLEGRVGEEYEDSGHIPG